MIVLPGSSAQLDVVELDDSVGPDRWLPPEYGWLINRSAHLWGRTVERI